MSFLHVDFNGAHLQKINFIQDDVTLKEVYELNETITLPKEINGHVYEYFLLMPSNQTKYGFEFKLDEIGQYHLKSRKDGQEILNQSFFVYPFCCEVSSEASNTLLIQDGIFIHLAEGDTVSMNQIIDLSSITKEDELLKIDIVPFQANEADFSVLTIKFVDIADPNSYIKVLLQSSPTNHSASYALAGATNQPLTGYEEELGRLHRNNQWGAFFPLSFFGVTGANKTIDLRFDSSTKEIYSTPNHRIIDLDDPDFFTNKWGGFTSGKVKIEIEASSYYKNTANFIIKSVNKEKLSSIYAIDTQKPILSIDCNKENVPYAILNKEFPLFAANAIDETDGNRKVNVKVYKNYAKTNQVDVPIYNNCFIPTSLDDYTIEYSAVDKNMNKAIETIQISVKESLEPMNFFFLSSSQIIRGDLGYEIKLADYYLSGGSGKAKVTKQVKFNGKSISIHQDTFIPEYEGIYEIVYVAEDYLKNKITIAYNFLATASNIPVFKSEPNLPKYFIKGKTYSFYPFYAMDYSKGYPEEVMADIYIEDVKLNQKDYLISSNQANLEVIYRFNQYDYKKIVPIIDVGEQDNLDLSKYFIIKKDCEIVATDNGMRFTSSQNDQIDFIKTLLSDDFSIKLSIENGESIEDVSIILTDSIYEKEKVKFTYSKYDDISVFSINDKPLYKLNETGFTKESSSNDFYLTSNARYVCPTGNINLAINTYENGLPFAGFSSHKVYLTIETTSRGNHSFFVKNVSNQIMNTTKKDRTKPNIFITGDYGGEYDILEKVTLTPAFVDDVLDPNVSFSLSVKSPSGEYVMASNGEVLYHVSPDEIYEFQLQEYGYYNVSYLAKDSNNGQEKSISYSIICEDKIKPSIDFSIKTEGKVNEKIVIKDIEIFDNKTSIENLKVFAYIVKPNGENILMKEGYYSFTPTVEGIYKVVICVYDEAGNLGLKEATIRVINDEK